MADTPSSSQANPALVETRLRVLVRAVAGVDPTSVDASLGAAIAHDTAFFLADDEPRAVGRAIQWAASRRLRRVELLASPAVAGDLARRAALLAPGASPEIDVWVVDGASVALARAVPATDPPVVPASHWELGALISEAGALAVDDHGQLVAEVAGLEVARVVDGPDGEGATLEVGVGQADRELSALIHTRDDADTGLRRVVAAVVQHRSPNGTSHHPLARLARERWLRALLIDNPGLVEATELHPIVPLRPRRGLLRAEPSPAAGRLSSGRPLVVLTSVGADLDLVPEAADYRQRWDPDAAVVLAMPERDLPLSARLLHRLPDATAVAMPIPWAA